jgi:hypothetical protein
MTTTPRRQGKSASFLKTNAIINLWLKRAVRILSRKFAIFAKVFNNVAFLTFTHKLDVIAIRMSLYTYNETT